MANDRYVVTTVECQYCKTKQKIHVAASTGLAQMGEQGIRCVRCNNPFTVTVPDKIVDGPFPA